MHPLQTLMRRLVPLVAVLSAFLSLSAAAQMAAPQEGKEYLRLKNPQPVETGKKIEVIEFFSYGCPHCGEFEPILQAWIKSAPADVQFRRVPVMFQDRWVPLAKIYYTLEALGEEARFSPEVFVAVHGKGLSLWQDKTFFDWAASQGLDRKKVDRFNVADGLDSTLSIARHLLKSIDVNKQYGAVPMITCSPSQLNQVFLNLITNAAQAVEGKAGVITIATRAPDPEHVEVVISDNGKGIPADALPKIFDPFFTTKEIGKGTGLGLSIAYKIVEAHGGRIAANSTVGMGTRFSVVLPVHPPAGAELA